MMSNRDGLTEGPSQTQENVSNPLLKTHNLEAIASVQTTRPVDGDCTLRLQNRFFRLLPDQPVRMRLKDTVLIEQHLPHRGRASGDL